MSDHGEDTLDQLRARIAALEEERDAAIAAARSSSPAPAGRSIERLEEGEDLEAGARDTPASPRLSGTSHLRDILNSISKTAERDHSRDVEKEQTFSGQEEPAVHVEDWLANIRSVFRLKKTPDDIKTTLVVSLLRGRALDTFKSFCNALGHTGDRETTTWDEFVRWALQALRKDLIVERDKLDREYEAIQQRGSAEAFIVAYRSLVTRIQANPHARAMHTHESLILRFIKKLKGRVQVLMLDKDYATLEDVYRDATRKDNLSFDAEKSVKKRNPAAPTPKFLGNGSRISASDLQAVLASLGYDYTVNSAAAAGGAVPVSAVERDHSVAPGQPVPKLTPEITAWCRKHNACFRCRVKNAGHGAKNCPRFPDKELGSVDTPAPPSPSPSPGPEQQGNV